ncbi:MAG: metallophosphoesterase family protein [Tannerellaceae bacterium]
MRNRIILLFSVVALTLTAQEHKVSSSVKSRQPKGPLSVFDTSTPQHDFDLLLNSPTDSTIQLSVLFSNKAQAYIEYNGCHTEMRSFVQDQPQNFKLDNLKPQGINRYRLFYRIGEESSFKYSHWYEFKTIAKRNDSFCFTITADSHLDENCSPERYATVLKLAAEQQPVFHLDLGDTFMVDKYGQEYKNSQAQYLAQRYYLGIVGAASPVYLVQGNHDGENLDSKDGMTEWSRKQRMLFFPTTFEKNYYSIENGNTLIIVLDPFGFSPRSSRREPWSRTLGKEQYDWLEDKLRTTKAEHRFVFIHNLVGGVDIKGVARGGAEAAKYYEWGGYSQNDKYEFFDYRLGWKEPIHDLLKRYNIRAVFHGHDHVYANQEYDGIRYVCLPQPGFKNPPGKLEYAREYGYVSGFVNNISGYIKVIIDGLRIQMEYIDSNGEQINKTEFIGVK